MMKSGFSFTVGSIPFDEDYCPAENTRITTNFANLARGERRRENLQNTLRMIDNRFNSLVQWDNPTGDRFSVELAIISVELSIGDEGKGNVFPLIEMLQTTVLDKRTETRIDGIVGNNFSSYIRDYDFSVVLPRHLQGASDCAAPEDFGDLHGKLFKQLIASRVYHECSDKPPVICLSVSSSKVYYRTANKHPILGTEYKNDERSLTDAYFKKMGLEARYFMPPNSVAPLAFYHSGDLMGDYTHLELASTISTMETFQKIYRPEIYNANSAAAELYRPTLTYQDHSVTRIVYDREERSKLAVEQGMFAEEHLIRPYGEMLQQWSANCAL